MTTRNRENEQAKARRPSLLDEVLERRMLLYALAAGATLVSVSPAQAKVVFTPSHAVLTRSMQGSSLGIDLNNDGVLDFTIRESFSDYSSTYCIQAIQAQPSNSIELRGKIENSAAALKRGNPTGSGARFGTFAGMASTLFNFCDGAFCHSERRFLGVKFLINGEVHYGWIGFRSVTRQLTATLGGWAYETEPNTPIIAGDTGRGDPDSDSSALQAGPTSLEQLAAGHTAIAERRRRIAG